MTNEQLKELEDKLWDAANSLRAYGGLKASDYAVPVLGLIFLKFAENKYSQFEAKIKEEFEKDKGTRMERSMEEIAIATCGFYLPEKSRFDYLLNLPGDQKMASALKTAMEGIENTKMLSFKMYCPWRLILILKRRKTIFCLSC